jgi:hypothetical protein
MSDQSKAQYALDFVQANYTNGVTPKIRFAQTLTPAQMYDLGLRQPGGPYVEKETPMYTVILQGEFGMAQPGGQPLPAAQKVAGESYSFLQLSFDDTVGAPAVLAASPDGSVFKQALNDPSLPDYRSKRPARMEDVLKWFDEHPCPAPSDPVHDPVPSCEPMPSAS